MGKIKVSLITTVLNEETSIEHFLSSIAIQSQKPDEIIIIDAGSKDKTVEIIKSFQSLIDNLYLFVETGANRSKGRNLAIKKAKYEIVAMSDAGCRLDKNWLSEIIKPFSDKKIMVSSGFYQAETKTIFEKCVTPFALVMPDKIDPKKFLPSSRSMALRKSVWKKSGGFPEDYSDNEDYVYANKLKKMKVKMFFAQKAIVYWFPRKNLFEFWTMIYRFSRGDSKAGLRKAKMASVFLRFVIFIFLILSCLFFNSLIYFVFMLLLCYFFWPIYKNYRYVNDFRAIFILPVLQLTTDLAIIFGSIVGGLNYI